MDFLKFEFDFFFFFFSTVIPKRLLFFLSVNIFLILFLFISKHIEGCMGEEKKLPKKKNIFNEEEKKVKVKIYGHSFRCEHKIFSANL